MTDQGLNNEDVSAMRREGDLRAFLRQGIRAGQGVQRANLRQFQEQSTRPSADLPETVGHVPGAWPVGSADTDESNRETCACTRCQSYAKDRPAPEALLQQTQAYLDDPNT